MTLGNFVPHFQSQSSAVELVTEKFCRIRTGRREIDIAENHFQLSGRPFAQRIDFAGDFDRAGAIGLCRQIEVGAPQFFGRDVCDRTLDRLQRHRHGRLHRAIVELDKTIGDRN